MIHTSHRFSRAQQDIFLPYIERGEFTLIGATTENPSFRLCSALLSRCRVFTLQRLSQEHIRQILDRGARLLATETGCTITEEALDYLALVSDGDGKCDGTISHAHAHIHQSSMPSSYGCASPTGGSRQCR
jgi:putative ATPase